MKRVQQTVCGFKKLPQCCTTEVHLKVEGNKKSESSNEKESKGERQYDTDKHS